jgi:hypothetical protein
MVARRFTSLITLIMERTMATALNSLKEVTARQDRCGLGTCPAVFQEAGTGKLVIIGAQREVSGRVGLGESAVAIDQGLLSRAVISGPVSGILRRGANLLMRAGL